MYLFPYWSLSLFIFKKDHLTGPINIKNDITKSALATTLTSKNLMPTKNVKIGKNKDTPKIIPGLFSEYSLMLKSFSLIIIYSPVATSAPAEK